MTTSQEWAERFSGYVPRDRFEARATKSLDRRAQIARVMAMQGLPVGDATDQLNGRIYEARKYIKERSARGYADGRASARPTTRT